MKVKELIEKLQEFDPEMEVVIDVDANVNDPEHVEIKTYRVVEGDLHWTRMLPYVTIS